MGERAGSEPAGRLGPSGFLAEPASGTGPGVLVLHPWWGLNETMRALCRRLAEAGFVAFAPDLYHGEVADTIPEAERLRDALVARHEQARVEVQAAALLLSDHTGRAERPIAVIGLSLGAYFALDLSVADPRRVGAVVVFYGTGVTEFGDATASYLGHFAENDRFESPAEVDGLEAALERAGRPATFHRYPGTGHWFFESDRTDAYDEDAAALAWRRTSAFLHKTLGG